jgi:hypothetical protein
MKPKYLQDQSIQDLSGMILKAIESLVCISSMVGNDNSSTINKI